MQTMGDIDEAWWKKELAKAEAAETKTKLSYTEPVPEEELAAFEAIGTTLRTELAKRDGIIERLQERLERLEEGKARHAGTWQTGRSYGAGEFVTRSGSLWFVKKDFAAGAPGESPDFKLVVKKGEVK
jgi:hypothetical protein